MMRLRDRPVLLDTLVVVAVVAVSVVLALIFDPAETWYEATREYEAFELDEIFGGFVGLLVAFAWFSYRRLQQAQRELRERMRLEGQLVQAQKMEAIGLAAGGIAHDFNNDLAVILGHTELLARAPETKSNDSVRIIRETVLRSGALSKRLLEFSRPQLEAVRPIDLDEILRRSAGLARAVLGDSVKLVTRIDPEAWPIRADPARIEQIILNLSINARDAMPEGGRVEIEVENVKVGAQAQRTTQLRAGDYVLIKFRDSGIGMSPSVQERIFEPFFTHGKSNSGTGLGLSIVYGNVTRWGGAIVVQSAPGEGTTFEIRLPRSMEQPLPVPDREQTLPPGVETIVLVEDQPNLRELVKSALHDAGHRVLDFPDAETALQASTGVIGALVTDVVLPGIDGVKLAARLRQTHRDLPVLYVTGHASPELGDGAERSEVLLKPFSSLELVSKVRALLDGEQGAGPRKNGRGVDPAHPIDRIA